MDLNVEIQLVHNTEGVFSKVNHVLLTVVRASPAIRFIGTGVVDWFIRYDIHNVALRQVFISFYEGQQRSTM